MAANIPANAKYGFWVAIGVLSALVVFHFVQTKVPALNTGKAM